eukprot:Gb_25624 [translate_table: standard]
MQTRKKTKLAEASAGFQSILENLHHRAEGQTSECGQPESTTLADASRKDVVKLLERVGDRRELLRKRQESSCHTGFSSSARKKQKFAVEKENALLYQRQSSQVRFSESQVQNLPRCGMEARTTLDAEPRIKEKNGNHDSLGPEFVESMNEDALKTTSGEGQHEGPEVQNGFSENSMDGDEFDWEDGIVAPCDGNSHGHPREWNGELTIEVDDDSNKQGKKRSIRRATAKDKEFAELVHKVHLLCLIARGRLVDSTCDDPLIQASLLSLVPSHLCNFGKKRNLTANMLIPFVEWFRNAFHVQSPDEGSSQPEDGETFTTKLAHAIESHSGTNEEVAALSVALLRALGLTTRYVSVLDVASLKPDAESLEASADWNSDTDSEDGWSMPHMNTTKTTTASLGQIFARCPSQTSHQNTTIKDRSSDFHGRRGRGGKGDRDNGKVISDKKLLDMSLPQAQPPGNGPKPTSSGIGYTNPETMKSEENAKEGQKRKGDVEFEMQLAMALAATATDRQRNGDHENNMASKDPHGGTQLDMSATRSGRRHRTKKSSFSAQENNATVWSRKLGPPLHWAEVYCEGETLTGRWVHLDAASGVVDGEQKVEAAAIACKRPLRYVLAFAGNGAKDVTRRYATKWSAIVPQRVYSRWWEATISPFKELEAAATAGALDMETSQEKVSEPFIPTEHKNKSFSPATNQHGELNEKVGSEGLIELEASQACATSTETGAEEAAKYVNRSISLKIPAHRPQITDRSSLEDMELETRAFTEPLPTSQQAYRNHHLYVLERWLTKYQTLHPKGPVLGYCAGQSVYPRTCVQNLHTSERWLREGLQVKKDESPAKILKASRNAAKGSPPDPSYSEEDYTEGRTIALFGKWQTEPLQLPPAVGGIVPKNERGQVDVWSEKCLPPGTVHLRMPRLVNVAKRLGIDFAPAMVGFEIRNGRSVPLFEGIVICREFRDALLQAYSEEEERRIVEEKKKSEHLAISRWCQLLRSVATRQRLQNAYEETHSNTDHQSVVPVVEKMTCEASSSMDGQNTFVTGKDETGQVSNEQIYIKSLEQNNGDFTSAYENINNSKSDSAHHHIHIFPDENQSYDQESAIRTKHCPCGFTIQVEEM